MPIDRVQKKQIERVLGDPDLFPDKFKTWIQKFINNSPLLNITASQLAGFLPGGKINMNYGTTAPFNPGNGDLWLYPADDTNGVNWLFRWNQGSASTYKWECIGGVPLTAENQSDDTTTFAPYVDLTGTAGPSLTVPRAGDYLIAYNANVYNTSAGLVCYVSVKLGGAATSDNESATQGGGGMPALNAQEASRQMRRNGLSASDVIKMQYGTNGGTFHARWRNLSIVPVRVI